MTPEQSRTLMLLEIQEGRRAWASLFTIRQLGVTRQTLNALLRAGLIEGRMGGTIEGQYRLTSDGEVLAHRLKTQREKKLRQSLSIVAEERS